MDVFGVVAILLAIYSVLLSVFGTIGNLLTFLVTIRARLRILPTYIFISFMMLVDTLSLHFWNYTQLLVMLFNRPMSEINLATCKITSFLQFFSLQTSAFLLVISLYRIREANLSIYLTKSSYRLP